jgi:hypothetical protein
MNTQENNKLIAEFMGLSIKEGVCYYTDEDDMFPMGIEVEEPYLPYDDSWDWLMPCLSSILEICSELDELERYHIIIDQIPDIDCTYQSVVDFIKWYNEQNY